MQDRVPTRPGRMKLTREDGTIEYVTMERADQPTQEGTPLNKATLLSDATAALLGDVNTPDEALEILMRLATDGKSVIFLDISSEIGLPVENVVVGVDSSPNLTSSQRTNRFGKLILNVPVGTHTLNFTYPIGWIGTTTSKSVTTLQNSVSKVSISNVADLPFDQELAFSSSRQTYFRTGAKFQAFLVGGGGSGAASEGGPVGGGGGGKTAMATFAASSSLYTLTVGAGGTAVSVSVGNLSVAGKAGGTTSLSGGNINVAATGGTGGQVSGSDSYGGNGGSGGGGAQFVSRTGSRTAGNGGSNGANGSTNGGSGQGTTTRKWGISTGTLYSGGGGGAIGCYFDSDGYKTKDGVAGVGGSGGGGSGAHGNMASVTASTGTLGGGGGACSVGVREGGYFYTATSGAGGPGAIVVRRTV